MSPFSLEKEEGYGFTGNYTKLAMLSLLYWTCLESLKCPFLGNFSFFGQKRMCENLVFKFSEKSSACFFSVDCFYCT